MVSDPVIFISIRLEMTSLQVCDRLNIRHILLLVDSDARSAFFDQEACMKQVLHTLSKAVRIYDEPEEVDRLSVIISKLSDKFPEHLHNKFIISSCFIVVIKSLSHSFLHQSISWSSLSLLFNFLHSRSICRTKSTEINIGDL